MANEADICTPQDVLNFWFGELTYDDWFGTSHELDQACIRRFQASHLALARGVDEIWRASPENRLAAIVLLDQMPRNMFRGTPLAFATDCLALHEAKLAVGAGADMAIKPEWRAFVYLPFEHSENLTDQTMSVKLFTELGDADRSFPASQRLPGAALDGGRTCLSGAARRRFLTGKRALTGIYRRSLHLSAVFRIHIET
jgi:uncharacterized protein (DUF924 family)